MANALGVCFSLLLFAQVSTCDYIPSWSCDFEHSLCHWVQSREDQLEFLHVTGNSIEWKDHTTDSGYGKLLYLVHHHGYINFKDQSGNLMSRVLMPNNGSCKMTLHYKIFQYSVEDRIQVFVNMVTKAPSGGIHRQELFHSVVNATRLWKSQDVILQSNVEFQVEIVGVHYSLSLGKLGIDDVWFSNGCYLNEQSPLRLIQLWSSPSYNYPAGIFYENVNDSWSSICSEDKARWACNRLGLKDVLIGSFSSLYHLTSGQSLCLPSNITIPAAKTCNGESSCTNVTYWECKQEYTSLCSKFTHKACTSAMQSLVCISANRICDFYDNCPGGEDESDCLVYNRCDFQNGMCDWMPGKHTSYEWKRYFDISSGQYCLKVDASKEEIGVALLKFNYTIQGSQNRPCGIRFTFKLRGSLRLLIFSDNRTEVVWSAVLSFSSWRRIYAELPSNKTYTILFEASVKHFYKTNGEFLLANISFSRHCNFISHPHEYSRNDPSVFVCYSGEAVSRKFVCDFKKDCYDGSDEMDCNQLSGRCNFESSFCDWQIGSNAPERLRRMQTFGSRWLTGPPGYRKNKAASRYYVHLDTRRIKLGAYAHLISTTMQRPVTNKCTFRWFYHMFHNYWFRDKYALSIIYKDLHDQSERILWQLKQVKGEYWHFGSVTFNVTSFLYKIYIRAEREISSRRSDVAIDDVSFAPECLKIQDFEPITITSRRKCSAVKFIVSGSTASIFQCGDGEGYCSLLVETDPRLRISLYAEFFRTDFWEKVVIRAGGDGREDYGGEFSGSFKPFSLTSSRNKLRIRVPPIYGNKSHAFTFNITSTDTPGHAAIYYRPSGVKRIDVVRSNVLRVLCRLCIECLNERTGAFQPWMKPISILPEVSYGFFPNWYATFSNRGLYIYTCQGSVTDCKGSFKRFVLSLNDEKNETLLPRVTQRMKYNNRYYPEERCSFKFVASNGYRITFFFHIFETEPEHDYLQILNNGIIGQNRFSGKHEPFYFISKRSNVDMIFYSDENVEKVGFSLSVIATDENAMPYAPWSHLNTAIPVLTMTTTSPVLTTTDSKSPIIEKCSKQLSSRRHSKGSHIYGEIDVELLQGNSHRFVSGSCSWKFNGEKGVKYLLQFTHINTGSIYNSLSVEYGHGKWKNFTGTQSFDLIEIGSQFSITLKVTVDRPLKISLSYSKSPGCYWDSLRTYYEFKHRADSRCYCEGYKYGFLDGTQDCYCGNDSPASFNYPFQNPKYCASCSNCRHGFLFIHEYNKWLRENNATAGKPNSFTIAIAFTVVLCILIFGVCMYYCRKKRRSSPRNENVAAGANTGEDEGSVGPSAHFINASCPEAEHEGSTGPTSHFINASCPEETLPSYEDATKVRLLMPGSRHSSQNVLQPGSDDGQRSLNAAQDNSEPPPHYDELFQAP